MIAITYQQKLYISNRQVIKKKKKHTCDQK